MNNSMMMMQSPHRMVLEARPDTEESKAKLIEELQSRGRAAVGAKSWMDAKMLYEKALEVIDPTNTAKVAVFHSNLSLVEKSMGHFEEARKAADAATRADRKYVKGWWRLGQALQQLHRNQEALEAMSKAKVLEPTNKALIKEYQKLKNIVEEEKELMEQQAAAPVEPPSSPMPVDPPSPVTKTTAAESSKKSKEPPTPTTKPTAMAVDDDNLFTKSDAVRGYKVVNGKKTSYFHNELSEEAKTLIGDIAPKKLDSAAAPVVAAPVPAGVSAWNKAGTWEEKDVTKWATNTLTDHISQTTYTLPKSSPAPGALVTVSNVKKLDGHASFALARGKKRYIYEFMAKIEWKLSGGALDCSGSLALPDIDGTIEMGEGYEMHEFLIDSVSDNNVRPLIERFVQRGGFHEALNESIDDWVRTFKKTY